MGLTKRVQPYCRLATAIMATIPAANWIQRLRSPAEAGDADETAIRTSRDVHAVPSCGSQWPDGPTYLPHYCRCKSLLMGCQHPGGRVASITPGRCADAKRSRYWQVKAGR